ncbi:DJ-1/PfpI family protein [Salinirubellus salinus]|jgi:transcriptional regulator GlxA family with amidase domain|uniref:DJ-1/PfpI family protein n=1 Tax=Salinirubellus salinus TaxID=1364945 RepID=A0A9E7R1P5_9EURY|nr:DJ-1/PfpI family protein [Salinirubellus salinus]UWM53619.1 DJ-1/PfpI family protein [Salinirubellus salinus]
MDLQILLYDGFDEVDAIAPYEVFRNAETAGAALETTMVTLDERDTVTASHDLEVGVQGTLGSPDALLVPGGGWGNRAEQGAWGEYERGDVPEAVAEAYDAGATVLTVCTGGMLAAKSGVLNGRPATTHHVAHADLRDSAAEFVEARVVDDGRVLTCGGVTSGLDLAVHFVRREFGDDVADTVQAEMEYEPRGEVLVVE